MSCLTIIIWKIVAKYVLNCHSKTFKECFYTRYVFNQKQAVIEKYFSSDIKKYLNAALEIVLYNNWK